MVHLGMAGIHISPDNLCPDGHETVPVVTDIGDVCRIRDVNFMPGNSEHLALRHRRSEFVWVAQK